MHAISKLSVTGMQSAPLNTASLISDGREDDDAVDNDDKEESMTVGKIEVVRPDGAVIVGEGKVKEEAREKEEHRGNDTVDGKGTGR